MHLRSLSGVNRLAFGHRRIPGSERVQKENRELKRERDFFKLAAAHFAKEQLSPKSINS
jgi:hypothetical protein